MKRSKHNLSHYHLATFNQGELVPLTCFEVLPGDSIRQMTQTLMRTTPLVNPVMHPVYVQISHFFVPSRLVWSNWEDFITGSNTALTIPTIDIDSADTSAARLAEGFGIGIGTTTRSINALPFRAYNLIYNEFYRDQDLTTAITQSSGDTDDVANYGIKKVSWEKDYFTTARAEPQQAADTEAVSISFTDPLIANLYVGAETGGYTDFSDTSAGQVYDGSDGSNAPSGQYRPLIAQVTDNTSGQFTFKSGSEPSVQGTATGSMDINAFRTAMAMQRMREHRNRYGSRYRDLLAFLGVQSGDARLQRPERLGGGRGRIAFSEVVSTADTTDKELGDLAGHGIGGLRTRPYKRFMQEHGYVITLMNVKPKTVYQDAIPRTFLRSTYDDFWQKELEALGAQEITNVELYSDHATPAGIFGYVGRHEEYRRMPSSVAGEFRTTLDDWHMARQFSTDPALNATFVEADPTNRIYSTTTPDELKVMAAHQVAARRLVSKRARNG